MLKTYILCIHVIFMSFFAHAQEYHERSFQIFGEKSMRFRTTTDTTHYLVDFPLDALLDHPLVSSYDQKNYGGYTVDLAVNDSAYRAEFNYWVFDSFDDPEWWALEQIRWWYLYPGYHADDQGLYNFGDNSFYSDHANHIHFIRNNILVQILSDWSQYSPEANLMLAHVADSLLAASPQVTKKSHIPTPKIHSMQVVKEERYSQGIIEVRLDITDPLDREYVSYFFGCAPPLDPNNDPDSAYFVFEPSYHPTKCWVVSDKYYVSSIDYVYPTSAVTDEDDTAEAPQVFTLLGNTPNPFNPVTAIRYDLHRAADVRLTVHDALGRVVDVLVDEHQTPGRHAVTFTGDSSGMYFYRLEAGGMSEGGKMVMVK